MKNLISLIFMFCIVYICVSCTSIDKIRAPSSFVKTIGYEGCKIYGPLNELQANEIAQTWNIIDLPDQDLSAMLSDKSAGKVYFFNCVQKDKSGIPAGIIFFGLVENNTVVKKAIEIIEN